MCLFCYFCVYRKESAINSATFHIQTVNQKLFKYPQSNLPVGLYTDVM